MKILVTGATGFIGNYVIEELLKSDVEIIATSTNIDKAKSTSWFSKVQYIPFSFSNNINNNIFEYFHQPNILIHLAWQGLPNYKAEFHLTENLPQQKIFLQNIIENGLKNLTVTGTCFEYGMKEGELDESMECKPDNTYAIAKNELRIYLEHLKQQQNFNFKWIRLFYMFGKGQSPKSLISQLDAALENGDDVFNMSGGEQVRDFLPIEEVAKNIVDIALQNNIEEVINNCSGKPITVKDFVQQYLQSKNKNIQLNLGYYPYSDFEPFKFWGNNKRLKSINTMHNKTIEFIEERKQRINKNGNNNSLLNAAKIFNDESNKAQYSYNFSWMGRPIIQYPQDMIAMQELIWELKPDLIIETGIAHGGSLIFYASIMELIGKGEVLGIDIDIREHNKEEIEKHPMFKRIKMIQGSAIDTAIVAEVKKHTIDKKTVMVLLDSNHTHEHVLAELNLYSPFVTKDSYLVVFDTIVEDLPEGYFSQKRPWGIGNNPKTAMWEFLKQNSNFEIDSFIDNKLLISVAPQGYLKRIL